MDGSQPGGDCWEGARTTLIQQQCGGPRPRLPPNDPHPYTDFCGEKFRHGDNSLDKITTTDMSCVATSSTVKDDVSALFWVLRFHLNKVLRTSTAQEESDINSTSTQKYKNTCLLWFCVVSNSKLSPQEDAQFNFLRFYFQIIFIFSVVGSSFIKTDNNIFLEQKY